MRKVIFLGSKILKISACGMRAFQIYEELVKYRDCDIEKIIENIHNSYVVFIKDKYGLNTNFLQKSKDNNNINILDVIDLYDYVDDNHIEIKDMDLNKNGINNYIDAYIVNNNYMLDKYTKLYNKFCFVIPHHYDIRWDNSNLQLNDKHELNFLFNGGDAPNKLNCLYIPDLKKDYNIKHSALKSLLSDPKFYNCQCHISIRKPETIEFNNKPAMKLATACGANRNIITTYDMSVRDILDKDYPYILYEHDYESVKKMFDYVKETYNTDVWFKGLEIIKELRKKLSLEYIVKNNYVVFFEKLDELFPVKN